MAKSSEVIEQENLFIAIEYFSFYPAMYMPQPARVEVFDPSV